MIFPAKQPVDIAKKLHISRSLETHKTAWSRSLTGQHSCRQPATVIVVKHRRIHYLLLNAPPLKHDKKPDSKYQNDKNSYKALTHLLIRARLSGEIPMQAIEDSTRPIQLAGGFQSLEQFVGQEVSNFLNGYTRELTIGQPDHIEIMLEKMLCAQLLKQWLAITVFQ